MLTAVAAARRVRIKDLLPEPLEVELPDGTVATVQDLGVDDMMAMMAMEAELAASGSPDDEALALSATRDFVCNMILRDNPGVFPTRTETVERAEGDGVRSETVEVPVFPNWPPAIVFALLAALSGDDSVAESVRHALLGDDDEIAEAAKLSAADREARIARGETVDEEEAPDEGDPLTSTQPSPTPSLSSDGASVGDPNGGSTPAAPGVSSQDTSDIYAAAV